MSSGCNLLEVDPPENLFVKVRRLGLPVALQKYLVFDLSLDCDDEDNTDEN